MQEIVRRERVGRVEVLTLERAGPSALMSACEALGEALDFASEDPLVAAVALLADGRHFDCPCELPTTDAALSVLCAKLEGFPKPVVVGMSGPIVDNGVAIALASHYRLAARDTFVSMPCLNSGLFPAVGTIQRLTRIVGAAPALDLLLGANDLPAEQAESVGLIDGVVKGGLSSSVIALARRLAASGAGIRPSRTRNDGRKDLVAASGALAEARRWVRAGALDAQKAAVDAVTAAIVRPWREGFAIESRLSAGLRTSAQAAALAHIAEAETRAVAPARVTSGAPFAVERIAVMSGQGPCPQSGVVLDLMGAGFEVTLVAAHPNDLLSWRRHLDRLAAQRGGQALVSQIKGSNRLDPDDLPDLALMMPGAPSIAVRCPVALLQDPVAGGPVRGSFALRFAPLNTVRSLVEIVADQESGGAATAVALVRRLGRLPLCVKDRAGHREGLVGPLYIALLRSMECLVEDGATPGQVDAALKGAGYAEGLFAIADSRGLETDARLRARTAQTRDPRARYPTLSDRLIVAGRTGWGAGAGYHQYDSSGSVVADDAEMLALLSEARAAAGIAPRRVTDREIIERADLVLALTGMRLLDAESMNRFGQVDLAAVAGIGFPRWRGGPLHAAMVLGAAAMEKRRRAFEPDDPQLWARPPLLDVLFEGREHGTRRAG